jgi:nitric oxide reductase subunit B
MGLFLHRWVNKTGGGGEIRRRLLLGLNGGLVLKVVTNLFPGGVSQLLDVLRHGYWHARRPEFVAQGLMHTIEWLSLPADAVFIGLGVVPMVLATALTCQAMSANLPRPVGSRGG